MDLDQRLSELSLCTVMQGYVLSVGLDDNFGLNMRAVGCGKAVNLLALAKN